MNKVTKTIQYFLMIISLSFLPTHGFSQEKMKLENIYAISSELPRQLISLPCTTYIADHSKAYFYEATEKKNVIYSVTVNLQKEVLPKEVLQWKRTNTDPIPSTLLDYRISFTNSFITNPLEDAGNCYVLPKDVPKDVKKITITNFPDEYVIDACSAVPYDDQLVLRLLDAKRNETYYAFLDLSSGMLQKPFFSGVESSSTCICWRGDNLIWEISRSKKGYFFYAVYDTQNGQYVKKGDSKINDDESILIFKHDLLLINKEGKIKKVFQYPK